MSVGSVAPGVFDREWDFVVVGGGTAGLVASQTAAEFGARTLLIESDRPGGECLWTGCVPSKALIAAARAVAESSTPTAVSARSSTVDFSAVMGTVRNAIALIEPHDSVDTLKRAGVTTVHGRARFIDGRTLMVGERSIRFRQAMIATGASSNLPPFATQPGFKALTAETVWDLSELPERMLMVGGGPVGCELAQAFARLGCAVTLVQSGPRLLPRECAEAERVIATALTHDGVDIRQGCTVLSIVSELGFAGRATLEDGTVVDFDRMLVAVGKTPTTSDLGLAAAGVDVDQAGSVTVNETMRTSNERIWAAGDVTGAPYFTHTAGVDASVAAANAILGLRRTVDRRVVPRVTFTQPEVAAVGIQGDDDIRSGRHRVVTVQHRDLDRAITESETQGFTRVVFDRRGVVIGATIVGPRAGESLAEVTLAVKRKITASQLSGTTHPYPTYNDAVWNACVEITRDQLGSGVLGIATRTLAKIRRARLR